MFLPRPSWESLLKRLTLCARPELLALAVAWGGGVVQAQESPLFPEPGTRYDLFAEEARDRSGFEPEAGGEAEPDEIETDRDSFTPATTLTPQGRVIFETAYSFIDNRNTFDTHSFPESLLRFGITEWLEARLGWNYEVGGAGNTISSESGGEDFEEPRIERESQLNLGLKFQVSRQEGWIPDSALITSAQVPTSGPDTASAFVGTYVLGWTLERGMKFDAALRYGYDTVEHDTHNLWSPSVVLKVPVTERINSHIEYFGIFTSHKERNTQAQYISPGLHYLLTRDFEIGYRLGWGLTDDAARFFVNTGIGYRF